MSGDFRHPFNRLLFAATEKVSIEHWIAIGVEVSPVKPEPNLIPISSYPFKNDSHY